METQVISAFCGTGKTYICNKYPERYNEIECWNYRKGNFPTNYIEEVKKLIGRVKYIFISTDPVILKQLNKEGIEILLIYPNNSLKEEYLQRFCERNSGYDFIGVLYKHWDDWLDELKEQSYCKHIVMESSQYLEYVLCKLITITGKSNRG